MLTNIARKKERIPAIQFVLFLLYLLFKNNSANFIPIYPSKVEASNSIIKIKVFKDNPPKMYLLIFL